MRQGQSGAIIDAVDMKGPQAPEGAPLVILIAKALRKLQGLRPSRGHFGDAASGIEARRAQGGKKLHLLACIRLGDVCQCSERLLDAAAAFLHQRKLHPYRHCSGRQRDADLLIAVGCKCPVERGAQIFGLRPVFGQPFGRAPRAQLGFGTFKKAR